MPKGPTIDLIKAPGIDRKTLNRTTRSIRFLPPHEAMASEIEASDGRFPKPEDLDLPPAYWDNPVVINAKASGDPLPHPCVLFLDGVRYQSSNSGRADSVLGFWWRSFGTQQRHLVAAIRMQTLCRCGCRGWCTIHPVLAAIAHSMELMRDGVRDNEVFDGSRREASNAYSMESKGRELGFRAMLLFVTG